jgi:mono/diheme cytochrome c family protein
VSGRAKGLTAVAALLAILLAAPDMEAKKKSKRKKRAARPAAAANFDTKLPVLGTKLTSFPPGTGKAIADSACLACHSADMAWQQRLTEKQWTAEVNKMAGWGAPVPEKQRAELVEYLVKNFGPENDAYQPVVTRPVGR